MLGDKFQTRGIYEHLVTFQEVRWRKIFYSNVVRPKTLFSLWMVCHERMATKDMLVRFGMIAYDRCCFCRIKETMNHIFFQCRQLKEIWNHILCWLQIDHSPSIWSDEIKWIIDKSKGKGCKASFLRCAFTETIYEIQNYIITNYFGKDTSKSSIKPKIIDIIVYKCWLKPKHIKFIGRLMMPKQVDLVFCVVSLFSRIPFGIVSL